MTALPNSNLPPLLQRMQVEIEGYARGYGLDFYTTIFEHIDADDLNAIAAKGGFPVRYPHWRFGHGLRAARQGLPSRAAEDLRDGDQQRPVLRLPDEVERPRSTRSW